MGRFIRLARTICAGAALALPLLLGGSVYADEPVKPLPSVLSRLGQTCETRAGVAAVDFRRQLLASRKTKPGWKVFLEGGTAADRTMAAQVLARGLGRNVYRVDLASVVSKYIGETEKNLNKVFSHAENADVVLFFDEADALFGRRTSVRDAHDRYANGDLSYVAQRIQAYEGLVLLASNRPVSTEDRVKIVAGAHTVVPVGPKTPPPWRALCRRPSP